VDYYFANIANEMEKTNFSVNIFKESDFKSFLLLIAARIKPLM